MIEIQVRRAWYDHTVSPYDLVVNGVVIYDSYVYNVVETMALKLLDAIGRDKALLKVETSR